MKNNTFDEIKKIYSFLNLQITDQEINKIIDKYDFDKISSSERGEGNFSEMQQKVLNVGKTLHPKRKML